VPAILANFSVQEASMATAADELVSNFTDNLPQKWHKVSWPAQILLLYGHQA